jgi:hypothetical protein
MKQPKVYLLLLLLPRLLRGDVQLEHVRASPEFPCTTSSALGGFSVSSLNEREREKLLRKEKVDALSRVSFLSLVDDRVASVSRARTTGIMIKL